VVNTCVTGPHEPAEWDAAAMLLAGRRRRTIAADKSYDARRPVHSLRAQRLTPHVAVKRRFSAIDRRTTRHAGYAQSGGIYGRPIDEYMAVEHGDNCARTASVIGWSGWSARTRYPGET
jgi:hypothetical protein